MKKLIVLSLVIFLSVAIARAADKKTPRITLARQELTKVTVPEILALPELTDENGYYRVTEFTISLMPRGNDIYGPYTVKGNRIPANVLEQLKTWTNKPVNIVFDNVRAVGLSDHLTRNLNPIFLKCK